MMWCNINMQNLDLNLKSKETNYIYDLGQLALLFWALVTWLIKNGGLNYYEK